MLKLLDKNRVPGFTLAEVLITLAIIGVVAALTIPLLINYANDLQYKSAAKKAYSLCAQTIQLIKQEGEHPLSYYIGSTFTFKNDFMPYFKVIKDCGNSDCVASTSNSDVYTSFSGSPADTNALGGDGQFVTNDGMFFNIQQGAGFVSIGVDVNGYQKKPNVYGKDMFFFTLLSDRLAPNQCPTSACCNKSTDNATQGMSCMQNVLKNVDY